MTVTAAGWAITVGVILALFALDLALTTMRPHAVGLWEATARSGFRIGAAVAFGLIFASLAGWRYGSEYFAGYIVEKSLSVGNLFVFVIIMATFAVPPGIPAACTADRRPRRPGHARGLHRAWRDAAVAAVVAVPGLRAAAAADGNAAVPSPSRRP